MAKVEWGLGAAPLLEPSTTEATEIVAFFGDMHYPYQDDAMVKSCLNLIRRVKPHRIVNLGDTNDFFSISRFNKNLERLDDLQDEIDQANAFRSKLRSFAPNADIIEIPGNHCIRITNYVAENARALTSLRALDPHSLFALNENGITYAGQNGFLLRQNFLAYHGTKINKNAGATAKAEMDQYECSGISGHCHRLSEYVKNGYTRKSWTEAGGLFRKDADYIVGPGNWERGMAIGQFSTKSDAFVIELVHEFDGKLMYGGKCY
jgi:hypothetical protein